MTPEQLAFSSKFISDPAFAPHRANAVIIKTFTDKNNGNKYYHIRIADNYPLSAIAKDFKISKSNIWLNKEDRTFTLPFVVDYIGKTTTPTPAPTPRKNPVPNAPNSLPVAPKDGNNLPTKTDDKKPEQGLKEEGNNTLAYIIGGVVVAGILLVAVLTTSNKKQTTKKKIKRK